MAECASPAEAIQLAAEDRFVVIAGSLYLVGEAMELLHLAATPNGDERALNEWRLRKRAAAPGPPPRRETN